TLRAWGDAWIYLWMSARSRDVLNVVAQLEPVLPGLSDEGRARHAWIMGAGSYMLGEMDDAAGWVQRAVPPLQQRGGGRRHALGLTMLAGALPYETRRDEVEAHLAEAVALLRKLDDTWGLCIANAQLGLVVLRDGRHDEAIAMHEESCELARSMGNDFILALNLAQLAVDYLDLADAANARETLVECSEACLRSGLPEPLVLCLEGFAGVASLQRKPELAGR